VHERSVVVWDVPSAIERGSAFRIRVGVRCNAACAPDGWRVVIFDHDGERLAEVGLGDAPWPGTAALYHAEIELLAPEVEGLHAWSAVARPHDGDADANDADVGHAEARADFNVRSMPRSDCTLKVVAIDRERRVPVAGARVVVHPYRAVTDKDGIALLRLPRGSYRLFVSGHDYFPYRADGEVQTDTTIEAELHVDRGPSDVELWS
jgi:hypothetical protein